MSQKASRGLSLAWTRIGKGVLTMVGWFRRWDSQLMKHVPELWVYRFPFVIPIAAALLAAGGIVGLSLPVVDSEFRPSEIALTAQLGLLIPTGALSIYWLYFIWCFRDRLSSGHAVFVRLRPMIMFVVLLTANANGTLLLTAHARMRLEGARGVLESQGWHTWYWTVIVCAYASLVFHFLHYVTLVRLVLLAVAGLIVSLCAAVFISLCDALSLLSFEFMDLWPCWCCLGGFGLLCAGCVVTARRRRWWSELAAAGAVLLAPAIPLSVALIASDDYYYYYLVGEKALSLLWILCLMWCLIVLQFLQVLLDRWQVSRH